MDSMKLSSKSTCAKDTPVTSKPELNPLAKEFTQFASIPSTSKSVPPVIKISEQQNQQYLYVVSFILRHGLTSDSKFKFNGEPLNYIEFFYPTF